MELGSQTLAVPDSVLRRRPGLERYLGSTVAVGLRPKDFEDAAISSDHPSNQRLRAHVSHIEALGYEVMRPSDMR